MSAWIRRALIGIAVVAIAIQLIPYGRDHSNPPVVEEPVWDSAQTRQLAVGACFDCHSNATVWPWYSNVAPISWALQRDVEEGREALNFSVWHVDQDGDDAAETVRDGSMPPWQYTLTHPEARLSADQVAALEAGLVATFGDDGSEGESEPADSSGDSRDDDASSG